MATKRKTRRRRRTPEERLALAWRWGMVLAVVFVVGSIVAWRYAQSDRGRLLLADRGYAPAVTWATARWDTALLEGLRDAGVDPGDVAREPARAGQPTTLRVRTDDSLLKLNAAVSRAVESAGATVLRGSRREDDEAETLELHLGTARTMTHRLVARRGRKLPEAPPLPTGRLALVIDDLGHNLNDLTRRILQLPAPLTLAILPDLAYSRRVLNEAQRAGKRALLHMPMEPDPGAPVGPGEPAVLVGMDAGEIRAAVQHCLDSLPGVEGLNNHMGSYATRHRREMDAVMGVLADRGLLFLDSQTTSRSVAYVAADQAGVPRLRNDLFLDAETEDPDRVEERLQHLLRIARKRGWAVGIGHVNLATVTALERMLPELEAGDVQLVALPDLVLDLAGR